MRKAIPIAAGAAASITALAAAGSVFMASFTVNGKRQTLEEAWNWQKEHYDLGWYDKLEKTAYSVNSFDGYELHVILLQNPRISQPAGSSGRAGEETGVPQAAPGTDPSDPSAKNSRYVIISHGYTDNRFGSLKYARLYLDRGYSCILYDLRGHGENEKTNCTYSIRESRDLACLIDDTFARYGQDITLGLHGESLGAATTIASLGLRQNAAFAVADCPFADIENVLKGAMKSAHLPTWFVDCAGIAARARYGYSFREMRPIDALPGNQVPLLFLHGEEDTFILPSNSERLQKATAGYSELHLIPGAGHAESVLRQPALYAQHLAAFLDHLAL